ncbi:hypothetical protein D3C76_274940 [compost metagenome]
MHQYDRLASGQWVGEVDHEGAIRGHRAGADDSATGIPHFHFGAGFAATRHGQAASTGDDVGDDRWRGDVRCHVAQRHRGVAGGVDHGDGQGLAIGLGRVEGQGEGAVGLDDGAADQVARGVTYVHPRARFGATGEAVASGKHQVGGLRRGNLVWCVHRAWLRNVAGGIGQGHLQGRTVYNRRRQLHGEVAVRAYRATLQQLALVIAYLDCRARFAATRNGAPVIADHQVGGLLWRRGIAAVVDIRRGDGAGCRAIARGIGGSDLQLFAIDLGWGEGDAEGAAWADQRAAQLGAIGCQNPHGAAGFGTPGDHAAIGADDEFGGRVGGGDVRCADLYRQGRCTGAVDGHHIQQFAIGLCGCEHDGKGAFGTDHHAADQGAVGIVHFYAGAGLGATADAGTVFSDHQLAWAGGYGGQRHIVLQGFRGIAGRVGLDQAQAFARLRGGVEVDQEGAVGKHGTAAQQVAIDVTHFDAGPRFTAAAEGQAVGTDHDGTDRCRWGDVRGIELQRSRGVAGGIHQADVEGFAIGLCRRQRKAEAAVVVDQARADQVAISVADLHRGTRLAATGQGHAIGQGQAGRLLGCLQVWRDDRARFGGVACGVGQYHLQGTTVFDGRVQGELEAAIRVDRAGGQEIALGIAHLHAGPGFAAAVELAASEANHQVGWRLRWGGISAVDVRGRDRARRGAVASVVGGRHLQHLTVDLRWVEGDVEDAGRANQCTAKFSAIGRQDPHGATGFGTPGNHAAIGADGKFGRCGGRGDVGCAHLHWQRRCAGAVDSHQVEQLAIGLGRVEDDGEGAFGADHDTADQGAIGIMHFHARTGWGATADAGTVFGHHQVAWAGRRGGQGYVVQQGFGGVAAWVALHQAQLRARLGCWRKVNQEGAVFANGAGADQVAIGVTHFDAGPRFAPTAQGQAVGADDNVADCRRWGDVRGIELQWGGAVASGIHQAHIQRLAIGLRREQCEAEAAVVVDQAGADQVASSIANLHRGARFAATGQGHAIGQAQAGRLLRGQQVWRDDRAGFGGVACGVGQYHLQGAAVVHGWVQGELEAAIRVDRASGQEIALGIAHLHAGPGFAAAVELAAGEADHQVGRCLRWRGVTAVDVRRRDRAGCGGIARSIGCGDLQHLPIDLRRVEGDVEGAGRADQGSAQFAAVSGKNTHGAARFGAAGDCAAVSAYGELAWGSWGSDVWCCDLHRQGRQARVIDGHHIQQFAVGLGRVEDDGEGAIGTRHHAADQGAVGIMHFNTGASRGITTDAGAVFGHYQVARAGRRGGQGYVVQQGFGGVAAWVGLHQAELRTRLCSRVEVDQEGAVGQYRAGANHIAIGIAYFNAGTCFATAAQGQAVGTDDDVADSARWGDVRSIELQRGGGVAGGILHADIQCLAVCLSGGEGDAEQAIRAHQGGADHRARCIAYLNSGTRFAATGKGHAFGQGQVGGLCRWQQVLRGDRTRLRNVACGIGQGHLQGAAIDHGRVKRDHEGAICTDGSGRQHIAGGVTHLHGGARFATAAELSASKADHQVGRCTRWGDVDAVDVRRGDGAGCRGIACGVGSGGLQHFAIDLWRVKGDAENTGRPNQGSTQFSAIGGKNAHGAVRLGAASNESAVSADGQFTRCGWRGDVWRGDLRRQGRQARVIDGHHIQQFAVGLGRVELESESTVGTGNGAADQRAIGIMHFHTAAGWGGTGEGGAVGIDGQLARAGRRGGQRYVVFEGNRSVAARVGLYQA